MLNSLNSFSQDKTAEYNPLAENKWAVIFEAGAFLNNLGGSAYTPFTLSGKYNFSKKNGLRLSISTYGDAGHYTDTHSENVRNTSGYDEGLKLECDLHYIRYVNADSKIKVYLGAGPYFFLNHSYCDIIDYQGNLRRYANQDEYDVGLSGVLGLEYFILDNISLLGEYYCTGYYYKSVETVYEYTLNPNSRYLIYGWAYDIRRMRLGFSVYF